MPVKTRQGAENHPFQQNPICLSSSAFSDFGVHPGHLGGLVTLQIELIWGVGSPSSQGRLTLLVQGLHFENRWLVATSGFFLIIAP